MERTERFMHETSKVLDSFRILFGNLTGFVKVGLRTLNLYEHSSGEKYSLGHPRSTRLGVLTMKIPEGRFFKIKTTLLMHARLHNTHITETHCGDDVTLTKT